MSLSIQMRTLTPLWTGGVEPGSSRPRETGLLGSLRWWYEGLIRGMGGHACDPIGDGRCEYDSRNKAPPREQLCPACWLFGCTGWQRRFRLDVGGLYPQALFFVASKDVYQATDNWLRRVFGGEEQELNVQALWGEPATLRVIPLSEPSSGALARVAFLLDTVNRWGALGAKPQHGFGQIEITGGLEGELVQKGKELAAADAQGQPGSSPPDFFSLDSFFSHVHQLTEAEPYQSAGQVGKPPSDFDYRQHFIPCAFDIRYKSQSKDFRTGEGRDFGMRPWFRDRWGKEVAHRLFGRSDARRDEDRAAGRIFASHLYRKQPAGPWHLKVWGHVPSNLQDDQRNPISVDDVARQVTAFVDQMFPGSELVQAFEREEVLGS